MHYLKNRNNPYVINFQRRLLTSCIDYCPSIVLQMNNLLQLGKWNIASHNVEAVFLRWWPLYCFDWPWHKVLSLLCFIDTFLFSLHINKELFHAYRAYIELYMHAGSLENFLSASMTAVAQLKAWTNSFMTKRPTCVLRNSLIVIVSGLPSNRDLLVNIG